MIGNVYSRNEYISFVYHTKLFYTFIIYLLLYVNDILITYKNMSYIINTLKT